MARRGAARRATTLILKRASASRPSGDWSDDDYDVLADGVVVGRIFRAAASPEGSRWILQAHTTPAGRVAWWLRYFLRRKMRCLVLKR
jgi:hypothetical protein